MQHCGGAARTCSPPDSPAIGVIGQKPGSTFPPSGVANPLDDNLFDGKMLSGLPRGRVLSNGVAGRVIKGDGIANAGIKGSVVDRAGALAVGRLVGVA